MDWECFVIMMQTKQPPTVHRSQLTVLKQSSLSIRQFVFADQRLFFSARSAEDLFHHSFCLVPVLLSPAAQQIHHSANRKESFHSAVYLLLKNHNRFSW